MTIEITEKNVLIVRITPAFLERGQIWFDQNAVDIHQQTKNPLSWWSTNSLTLEKDLVLPLSPLVRTLDEWGYQKVLTVRDPGEFAARGGIIDIFPINSDCAIRMEYEGNRINSIGKLSEICVADRETPLKKLITKPVRGTKNSFINQGGAEIIKSLKEGTYVVHVDHGIARYAGIKQSQVANRESPIEYLVLEYAENDKLRVPISVAEKVSPYVGFTEPTLTRLGGNVWEKTKRRVKEDALKIARELVNIYAQREIAERAPYNIDEQIAAAVEQNFAYVETPDQLQALADIRKDMTDGHPMDRVICGDVGFGKTEVALRAAAYAVSAGYQVALVTPTTILAHQHYKTFTERFEGNFPMNIRKLTRIETKAQQYKILAEIRERRCDIVIGTHRLLQNDINFSHLGLLIIDEEQRFGVKQKEYLKKKRAELDVLSLSATPIPRTLSFALSGLRGINVINTPPAGRLPIETRVTRYDETLVKKAIEKELTRNGQVYFLHNKIATLPKQTEKLQKMFPSARVGFMHAKLPETKLIDTIDNFAAHRIDILVSTTIMENGLDLANANTLIVQDATKLGLAQAHQIRGRIGRGCLQAYAYFLYTSNHLPQKARERLVALENAQHLGAGYQIALRDLEIRGAGNFLGREQSGSIARVGFNLYCQLLNEAIEEIRMQKV